MTLGGSTSGLRGRGLAIDLIVCKLVHQDSSLDRYVHVSSFVAGSLGMSQSLQWQHTKLDS